MKILCTICARAGSKGVKNKNIRLLLGKPLIAYTIEQALRWGRARRVVVSTDSPKIAEVAGRFGAEVPFMRPAMLATDSAAKLPAIRHAATECEKIFRERYDAVVDLDATSPLRRAEDLNNCLNIFRKKKPKVLFSVVKARRNPYFNMVEIGSNGFAGLCKKPAKDIASRQAAPAVYDMNASIYFYSRDFLFKGRSLLPFSDRTAVYVMDEISAFDIDSETDFRFIEFLMKEGIWKNEV